jgi:tousled-like kinase
LLLSQNTGDFLIRANTKKRQKVQESNNFSVVDHVEPQEAAYDGRKNDAESKTGLDVSKKKQGRGRASSTGRGRGSKTNNDVTKSQFVVAPVSAASQLDASDQKDFRPDGQLRNGECSLQDEDLKSLRAKIAMLEEELRKSRQDSSEYHHLVRNLENVLCECLSDLAICAYAITIFIYSHSPALLIILVMIYAGGKRSERSGTTREAKDN